MIRLPTKDEFDNWNALPVTNTLRELAQKYIDEIKDRWADGEFSYPTNEATQLKNAEALGEIKAWTIVKNLDLDEIMTKLGD